MSSIQTLSSSTKPSWSLNNFNGYKITQAHRDSHEGGGIAAFIKNPLLQNITLGRSQTLELHTLKIRLENNQLINLLTYYGKQENCAPDIVVNEFLALTGLVNQAHLIGEHVILVEDFNAKLRPEVSRNGRIFREFLDSTGLVVMNHTSICKGTWTRVDPSTGHKSTLDYVLASNTLTYDFLEMIIDEEGQVTLHKYKEAQKILQQLIEANTIKATDRVLFEIANCGGMNSKLFWNLIRNLKRPNSEDLLPIMKEDGTMIYTEPEIK